MRNKKVRQIVVYEAGERIEDLSHFARVLEPVAAMASFGLVAHQFGQSQRPENIACSRHAPADRLGDLAGGHVLSFNHGKRHGIAENPAQPRLPVAHLFHGSDAYHVFAIAKTWQRCV